MCLAIPGQVESIAGEGLTRTGHIRFGDALKEASLAFVPEAVLGDYVLVHAGAAISRLSEEEARAIFGYLEQIGETA